MASLLAGRGCIDLYVCAGVSVDPHLVFREWTFRSATPASGVKDFLSCKDCLYVGSPD